MTTASAVLHREVKRLIAVKLEALWDGELSALIAKRIGTDKENLVCETQACLTLDRIADQAATDILKEVGERVDAHQRTNTLSALSGPEAIGIYLGLRR